MEPPADVDALASTVYHTARRHRHELGVGLYESVYKRALSHDLASMGHVVEHEVPIRLSRGDKDLGIAGRADLVIDGRLVVEAKAALRTHPIQEAQLLTYLRLGGYPLGLLINFHAIPFREGVTRRANSAASDSPFASVASVATPGAQPRRPTP